MRIRLMHNPTAGTGHLPEEEMAAALRAAGHEAIYHVTKDEEALEEMVRDPGELVVVAGGDGTIARVAKRLVGREVPIAVLPAGTANNLANAVGATTGFASQLAKLDVAERRAFDVGRALWRGGECRFLESVGGGLIGRAIVKLDEDEKRGEFKFASPEEEKRYVMGEIRELLRQAHVVRWRVEADGRDLSGEYLLVEAMNIPAIGPGLRLAPGASVGDGMLDVVLIGEERREELDGYLERLERGDAAEAVDFVVARARSVVMEAAGAGETMHVDDEVEGVGELRIAGAVRLEVVARGLTFWVT